MQLPILVRVGLIALPILLAAQGHARAEGAAPAAPAATRRIAPIPDAAGLMDQNGRPLTEAAFAGRIRLVYFGYTHCPDSCPTALATVTQALDRLPPEIARRIVPVLVAADPARDDARVLGAYLEAFHPGFVAVTGPVAAIDDLAWSYGALILRHPDEGAAGYAVDHSTDLHLVGPAGDLIARLPYAIGPDALAERLQASVGAAAMPREGPR
jgi:protein SCO1/2